MKAEALLREGRLEDCLQDLQNEVRNHPADPKLRVFLFQLQCVLGQWRRAETQLKVLAEMNQDCMLLAQVFQPILQAELFRAEVFAGRKTPLIFGEPAEWVSWLVQATQLSGAGEFSAAAKLRDEAFAAAPALAGTINGEAFAWIADADERLGPMLEIMLEGRYYWVPFERIRQVEITPAADLRDLIWAPAEFTWENGGRAVGHLPVRYAGTEDVTDNQLRLARKTEWSERSGFHTGLGQRIFATDASEYSLLEVRSVTLNSSAPA